MRTKTVFETASPSFRFSRQLKGFKLTMIWKQRCKENFNGLNKRIQPSLIIQEYLINYVTVLNEYCASPHTELKNKEEMEK